ncbi:MAG: hypothetical protein ACO4CT_09610 [Planctomycetota bacterium]|jgi:hypothetical protein
MKWFLAGLAFAGVVALAVATAALEAHNIHRRRAIQEVVDRLDAVRIASVTEELRLRDATRLPELARHWIRLQLRVEGREGS